LELKKVNFKETFISFSALFLLMLMDIGPDQETRSLKDFVVEASFLVTYVLSETSHESITPTSEMMIGGTSPSYGAGYTTYLTLDVIADDSDIPVKTINFKGYSPVKGKDRIIAKIPRYNSEMPLSTIKYFDREFKEQEEAIELNLLQQGNSNLVLRTDRSADYWQYQ